MANVLTGWSHSSIQFFQVDEMKTILFQPRFVPMIQDGRKTQTIRRERKRPIKVGDELSLREWTGKPYRSKQREIGRAVVTNVDRISFIPPWVWVNDVSLGPKKEEALALADGFRDYNDMVCWFADNHGSKRFDGVVIHWKKIYP